MSCDNYSLLLRRHQPFAYIFTVRHVGAKKRGQIKSGLLFDNCKDIYIVQFDTKFLNASLFPTNFVNRQYVDLISPNLESYKQ